MDDQPTAFDDIAAAGSPATPDALRSILARHQRTRTRTLGVLLAVALVAGPVAGWAVGHSGDGGQQVATASSPSTPNAGVPSAASAPAGGAATAQGFAFGGSSPPKATNLFTRTTSDGIVIRAYRMDPPTPPPTTPTTSSAAPGQTVCPKPMLVKPGSAGATPGVVSSGSASASASASPGEVGTSTGGAEPAPAPPATVINGTPPPCDPGLPPVCKAAPSLLAEVSNDAAVGQSFDPIDDKQPTDALSHLAIAGFGVPEGTPATFVTVQTGAGVATVRLRLPSGVTDEMAPQGGVAVLAHGGPQPPADGTVVEALDAGGTVLHSMPITQPGPVTAIACAYAGGPIVARPLPAPATPPTSR